MCFGCKMYKSFCQPVICNHFSRVLLLFKAAVVLGKFYFDFGALLTANHSSAFMDDRSGYKHMYGNKHTLDDQINYLSL